MASGSLEIIANRVTALETKINSIEKIVHDLQLKQNLSVKKGKLAETFAEHVPLLGFKEAVIKSRRSLRYIWAVLFTMGVIGTAYYIYTNTIEYLESPTASIVKFVKQDRYAYPPLILCPGPWLDAEKAYSLGLSMDALKYSLAYADRHSIDHSINISKGKSEFAKFYVSRNYSHLLDYFKDISIDIVFRTKTQSNATQVSATYKCYTCENGTAPLEKVFIDGMICYVVQLAPENAKRYETWSGLAPGISVKLQDKTAGVIKTTINWKVYMMPDKFLVQPNFPPIHISPYSIAILKLNSHKFLTLPTENSPCLAEHRVADNYSAARCTVECLHKLYKGVYKCHLLPYHSHDRVHAHTPLSDYCNYFDYVQGTNITHYDIWNGEDTSWLESPEAADCVQECPHTCNRTIYTALLDSHFPIPTDDAKMGVLYQLRNSNMTRVVVLVDNTAAGLGGILVEMEVVTLSFSEFLSNVGGTMSLFLGCTFMTIFQILLFFMEYFTDVEKKN